MSSRPPDAHALLPLSALRRCDAICIRYEAALQSGESPGIEGAIAGLDGEERSYLLGELIRAELELGPSRADEASYRDRFPGDVEVVRRAFRDRAVAEASAAADSRPDRPPAGPELPTGSRVGPYRITALIGTGGMGVVYRGEDDRLGRPVAIKILPRAAASDPARRARFEREARAVAAIAHPNVMTIYDYGFHEGMPYTVVELIDGPTLRERLSDGPLSVPEAAALASDLSAGLAAAHEKGVVHRDLKPENIICSRDGRARILDFGLARLEPSHPPAIGPADALRTATGTVMGTVGYMSPEQVRGERVDARSDLFALGCVLYEAVSGRRAFGKPTATESMAAVLYDEPPPLETWTDDSAEALHGVIRRCLEKDPGRRFASSGEVVDALRSAPATPARRVGRWPPAATMSFAAAAALLLSMLAATALLGPAREGGPRADRSLAVLPFEYEEDDQEGRFAAVGLPIGLSNRLSTLRDLEVRPFDAMPEDRDGRGAADLGRALRVEHVLAGTIRRLGGEFVVAFQLVDAERERVVTGGECRGDPGELPRIQSEIAAHVADHLFPGAAPDHFDRPEGRPVVLEAYKAYVRGRLAWKGRAPGPLGEALEAYREAVALDPSYPEARAALAACLVVRAEYGLMPSHEAYPEARRQALEALGLDGGSADAHVVLGMVSFEYEWDYDEAEDHFLRALRLRPHHPTARQWYAEFLSALGRHDEAIAQAEEAAALDPASPILPTIIGRLLYKAGRFEESIAALEGVIGEPPGFPRAHGYLAEVFEQLGRFPQAIAEHEVPLGDSAERLRRALDEGGPTGYWRERLAIVEERGGDYPVAPATKAAMLNARMGRRDEALAAIDAAIEAREGALAANILVNPAFDPLRDDPRFRERLATMRLSP